MSIVRLVKRRGSLNSGKSDYDTLLCSSNGSHDQLRSKRDVQFRRFINIRGVFPVFRERDGSPSETKSVVETVAFLPVLQLLPRDATEGRKCHV